MHDLNFPIHARYCIFKPDLDPHEKIGPGLRAGSSLSSTAKEIENIAKAGKLLEPPK
jgi:hypothetical protein